MIDRTRFIIIDIETLISNGRNNLDNIDLAQSFCDKAIAKYEVLKEQLTSEQMANISGRFSNLQHEIRLRHKEKLNKDGRPKLSRSVNIQCDYKTN